MNAMRRRHSLPWGWKRAMASCDWHDRNRYSARRALLLWISLSGLAWALWLLIVAGAWRI
jgi:hypothetical protein